MQKETKNDVIDTRELKIKENTMIYDQSVIQLSNISRMAVSMKDKEKIPAWAFACVAIGVVSFSYQFMIGFILTLIGGLYIGNILVKNSDRQYFLMIELNSGRIIYFEGTDIHFMKRIVEVIILCINNTNKSYIIDLQNAKIEKAQFGDHGIIN